MRTLLILLLALSSLWVARAQTSPTADVSYVMEQTPRTPLTAVNGSTSYTATQTAISYVDGLGRPLQTVMVRAGGNAANDVVMGAVTYDAYNRPQRNYLPFSSTATAGGYVADAQTRGVSVYADQNPYSETQYEQSPLAKPTRQYGPGQAWRANGGKFQTITQTVATGLSQFTFDDNSVYRNSTYGPNDVLAQTTTDEQGNTVAEYTDVEGRLIYRWVFVGGSALITAYVYDDFGRLVLVLPPKLVEWFNTTGQTSLSFQNGVFTENAYRYRYNRRGLVMAKQVPGAGWTEMIYDRMDRLVLSQDQQDKNEASPRWRFTKYDVLDRPILTGRLPLNPASTTALQEDFYNQGITAEERTGSDLSYYTNVSFPASVPFTASAEVLTTNYYDTPLTGASYAYATSNTLTAAWNNTQGLLTTTLVWNLEANQNYVSSFWYDFMGRLAQSQKLNHLGGVDRVDNAYRFNGELLQTVLRHQSATNGPITTVSTSYTQDHVGRNTRLTHSIDGATPATLATYSYDAIGRLQTKNLGHPGQGGPAQTAQNGSWTNAATWQGGIMPSPMSSVTINAGHRVSIPANQTVLAGKLFQAGSLTLLTGGILRLNGGAGGNSTVFPQPIDYAWHIRGGLRGLNLNGSGAPALTNNRLFALKLGYEDAGYYNGNIGSQLWINGGQPSQTRSYTYAYDGASRLTTANYGGGTHTVNNISYDANGNIQSLSRAGADQLTYSYQTNTNKLLAVTDAISGTLGFVDGNTTGDDYEYYPDGSLKKDLNRHISLIEYNMLKLPRLVIIPNATSTNSTTVTYQYNANGQKLRMVVTGWQSNTGITSGQAPNVTYRQAAIETRDYIGPFQYVNGQLFEISHEEGRFAPNAGYEYFLKDHLGNVRVVLGSAGVSQFTDYDPWGLPLWNGLSGGGSSNRNTFLSQEYLAETGYQDLQHRLYDPRLGRFTTIDPLTESQEMYSPYHYSFNNPVLHSDPDGLCPTCPLGIIGGLVGGAIGGAIEAGTQLYQSGTITDWKAVGGAVVQGGITGGVAGLSGGTSLLATAALGAGANVVGGAASNAIQGKEITAGTMAQDAAIGAGAAVGGRIAGNLLDKATSSVVASGESRALSVATSKSGGHTMVGVEAKNGSTVWFEQTATDMKGIGKLQVGKGSFAVVDDVKSGSRISSTQVSPGRADAALQKAYSMLGNNTYNSLTNSCVTCAKQVLQAGGVNPSPLIFTPKGLENYMRSKK